MEILEDGHDRPLSRKFLRQSLPASRADRDDVSFYVRVAVDRSLTDPAKNHGVPPRYLNSVRQGFRSSELFSPSSAFSAQPLCRQSGISSRIRGPEQEPIETRFLCRCGKAINAGKRPSHQWKMVGNFSVMGPPANLMFIERAHPAERKYENSNRFRSSITQNARLPLTHAENPTLRLKSRRLPRPQIPKRD